ncbi:TIGR01244 family phosphatase [Stenotrophomonas maltophilia]|uniref:TIGR01244 family sulfur transferase n=1 Tax=Stenotrophomonas TaxID=40323 RepID=UPI0021C9EFEC|nr:MULTISPECIES: TIGR01244 family sulfur transferase [Stenotrophomonas]MCU0999648.1 TIGR01244 family phosphatase [Stenotrophomonas maltophilia]
MNLKPLSASLKVSGQLLPKDIETLKEQGVASVICNRPDNEQPEQPSHHALHDACHQAGMQFAYLPVASGVISDDQVHTFAKLMEALPRPVAAYCRTGTRVAMLWALSEVVRNGAAFAHVLSVASDAGYDLSSIATRLQQGPASSD